MQASRIYKASKTKKQNNNEKVEQLKVNIEKKKQSNAKALEVVIKLSEETVDEACLIDNVWLISGEQYEDVVDERVVNGWCGYALCPCLLANALPPARRYRISTTLNKVFDVTQRKKFCSDECYKASKFLGAQVPSGPVWLRDPAAERPAVSLLPLHTTRGIAGDEVDLGVDSSIKADVESIITDHRSVKDEKLEGNEQETPKPVNDDRDQFLTSKCLTAVQKDGECSDLKSSYVFYPCDPTKTSSEKDNRGSCDEKCTGSGLNSSVCLDSEYQATKHSKSNLFSVKGESVYEKRDKQNVITNDSSSADPLNVIHGETEKHIKINFISDSLTRESVDEQYLFKDNASSASNQQTKVVKSAKIHNEDGHGKAASQTKPQKKLSKSRLKGKMDEQDCAAVMKNVVLKVERVLKEWFTLETLCFIFGEGNVKEMLAEKHLPGSAGFSQSGDAQFYERYISVCKRLNILELEDSRRDASFRESLKQPTPDYEMLRAQAEQADIRVREFYRGDRVEFAKTEEEDEEGGPLVPLVDLHAQKALRRRILLDRLSRAVADVQSSVGLKGFQLAEPVSRLVATFCLSAHNVTLQPLECNLVAIVIIKMLSLRDASVAAALDRNSSKRQLTLLLMSYCLDSFYLDRFITWITEVDCVVTKPECG